MTDALLGGLAPKQFLARFWQRRPLLVRAAVPGFSGFFDRRQLLSLAGRDDLESRLVRRQGRRWSVEHGPFDARALARLPARGWTVLVQGIDRVLPEAAALMQRFSFIPYARHDDLMVSIAPPGGGVGPHFDSYDVFLLQGPGRRRWRIAETPDLELVEDAPLRILKRFEAEREWVLEAGDMLYLPPRIAHDGVAETECMTYSIGMRAPGRQELVSRFLEHLADRVELDGHYEDPGLRLPRHPAALAPEMVASVAREFGRIRWSRLDVERFLGEHLTEPRAIVVFDRPSRPLGRAALLRAARSGGIALAGATRMLHAGRHVFVNGESHRIPLAATRYLRRLADRRRCAPGAIPAEAEDLVYDWYRAGYLAPAKETAP